MITLAAPPGGGLAVANEKEKSAAGESGGSLVSASLIAAAWTVTVHVGPAGSGDARASVNLVAGEALCATTCAEPAGHCRSNAPALAFTGSLKLMALAGLSEEVLAPLRRAAL